MPEEWAYELAQKHGGSQWGFHCDLVPCIDGLLVNPQLKRNDPQMFNELMVFAHKNDLVIEHDRFDDDIT